VERGKWKEECGAKPKDDCYQGNAKLSLAEVPGLNNVDEMDDFC
jgi:hypothetical protein